MQPLQEVRIELPIIVSGGKHTLKVEVTAQPLHTDPSERGLYSTNDNLSDRIFKRDGLDGVFLSQNPVVLGKVLNPKRREAALL